MFYLYGALFTARRWRCRCCSACRSRIALALGARWFHGTSDALYRRLAYIIIAVSGLISLPVFDALR